MINWELLKELVDCVPEDIDKQKKKKYIPPKITETVRERDKVCKICGIEDKTGSDGNSILHIHHIIPNGESIEKNLILLCKSCHQSVHCCLYVSGKGKFVNVLKAIRW